MTAWKKIKKPKELIDPRGCTKNCLTDFSKKFTVRNEDVSFSISRIYFIRENEIKQGHWFKIIQHINYLDMSVCIYDLCVLYVELRNVEITN